MALCAIAVHTAFLFVRSETLETLLDLPYAGPFRLNLLLTPVPTSLMWPFLLLLGFMFMRGAAKNAALPAKRQAILGICLFVVCCATVAAATHLPFELRMQLTETLLARPIAMRVLVGVPLYVLLLSPAACTMLVAFDASTLKKHRALLLLGALFPLWFIIMSTLEIAFYEPLARAVLLPAHGLMTLFSDDVGVNVKALILRFREFEAWVGPACLGLNVLAGIIALAVLPACLNAGRMSIWKTSVAILGLTVALYAANIVRIAALTFLGGLLPDLAVDAFHSALGIAIAAILFVVYLKIATPWIEKKND